MGGDPSPSPLDLANQACVGVDPSALTLINAFSISQEEHIFPCDTEKSYFFQCPKAAPYQSSNRKADQRKKKKKKKKEGKKKKNIRITWQSRPFLYSISQQAKV